MKLPSPEENPKLEIVYTTAIKVAEKIIKLRKEKVQSYIKEHYPKCEIKDPIKSNFPESKIVTNFKDIKILIYYDLLNEKIIESHLEA